MTLFKIIMTITMTIIIIMINSNQDIKKKLSKIKKNYLYSITK